MHQTFRRSLASLGIALMLVTAACGGADGTASPSAGATHLSVGLGYIPGVQFAPFYLAQQSGAYAAAGLDVTLQNQIDPDLLTLVGSGNLDLALADGTSVIPAVSQGIPVRYIATIYGTLPNVVIARADAGIASPADLAGKRIGTPGAYGSGYLTLLGILTDAGVGIAGVQLDLYPDYGQTQALIAGKVDAITGYANNDLLQAEGAGLDVNVFFAADSAPFAGPGLITAPATIAAKGAALRAFVAATLDAMAQIKTNPQLGVDATAKVVPEIAATPVARATALKVLEATIQIWSGAAQDANGYGALDPNAWKQSIAFLAALPDQHVKATLSVNDVLDTTLLPTR